MGAWTIQGTILYRYTRPTLFEDCYIRKKEEYIMCRCVDQACTHFKRLASTAELIQRLDELLIDNYISLLFDIYT